MAEKNGSHINGLRKIWLQLLQYFGQYDSLNTLHIWFKNAYLCPKHWGYWRHL